jgi:hypothetical protein
VLGGGRGHLLRRFFLGLCLAAHTKDSMMFRLVRSGTDSTQLGLEGAHCGTVAVSSTPRADGDTNLLFGRKDGESDVAEHEAMALKATEVLATLRIVYVKEHHAGVQLVGVPDQAGHSPLVQVNSVLPFRGNEDILDLLWSDRNGFTIGVIG